MQIAQIAPWSQKVLSDSTGLDVLDTPGVGRGFSWALQTPRGRGEGPPRLWRSRSPEPGLTAVGAASAGPAHEAHEAQAGRNHGRCPPARLSAHRAPTGPWGVAPSLERSSEPGSWRCLRPSHTQVWRTGGVGGLVGPKLEHAELSRAGEQPGTQPGAPAPTALGSASTGAWLRGADIICVREPERRSWACAKPRSMQLLFRRCSCLAVLG